MKVMVGFEVSGISAGPWARLTWNVVGRPPGEVAAWSAKGLWAGLGDLEEGVSWVEKLL